MGLCRVTEQPARRKYKGRLIADEDAADRLGVSRCHLNRVLNGHRESRSLTARYNELVESLAPAEETKSPCNPQAKRDR
jgi:transcriptional regulator with XRE-family HTH domain